jgi:N-acetylated-alpha-linked acidic dipeptidase
MESFRAARAVAIGASLAILAFAAYRRLSAAPPAPLFGYSAAASAQEVSWEQKFRALPQADNIRANMQYLSAYPHNAGTPRQHTLALWVMHQLQADGFSAHLEHYQALYPTPLVRQVELVAPEHYQARLQEPPIPQDPTSGQSGQMPTVNMYAVDGNVTAPLVYVNYGLPSDYAELAKLGISVRGKIVIARYGMSWRGIKPKLAHQHGAIGCLIYSDPRDDGYYQGDTYPNGPYRPKWGVQRGSVLEMELYPGDPETPGWGSVPGAKRLPLSQVTNLEKIPVQPLSWGDALPLLRALGGPVAPPSWRGALPITYHVGPGPAVVHLNEKSNWGLADLYDVVGTIRGSKHPNQWVLRGNHLDAWVNGAADPLSGQSSLVEEARALGVLLKQGWRPKRTIVYCAWDGEEPGLLGSTEFSETHAAELQQKAVAYINTDDSSKGFLGLGGSQTLQHFLNQVAQDVTDPQTGASLWQREQQHLLATAATPAAKAAVMDGADIRVSALGSGSDFSPFLQHLGIAAANLGFGGEGGTGVYHSAYDDFYWYTHFGDTTYVYERALAQTIGTAVMRLADADVLPFQFTGFADNLRLYERQIEGEAKAAAGAPAFDFTPLRAAVERLHQAAASYDQAMAADAANGSVFQLPAAQRNQLNHLLYTSERALLSPQGLPHRPWYQHQIYAPGLYTGYGVKTMPGVREAIEQGDYATAAQEEKVLVGVLDAFTRQVEAARSKL